MISTFHDDIAEQKAVDDYYDSLDDIPDEGPHTEDEFRQLVGIDKRPAALPPRLRDPRHRDPDWAREHI